VRRRDLGLLAAGTLLVTSSGLIASLVRAQTSPATSPPATAFVDAVAFDASGRQATDLTVVDLRVSIDGQPRQIVSLRYVFRGPGAESAARSAALATGSAPLSEPSRTVLIAVDENSIVRGGEKAVVREVWRTLDGLASADRVALVALPLPHEQGVLSTSRGPVAEAVTRLAGRGAPPGQPARADDRRPDEADTRFSDEEERERREATGEREQTLGERQPGLAREQLAAGVEGQEPGGLPRTSLQALARLLQDMRSIPGQKTIVYLWAGAEAPAADPKREGDPRLDRAAVLDAAAAARAVIHFVNAARAGRASSRTEFERVAQDAGGIVARATASGPDLSRLSAALSGAYLVEIETRADDRDSRPHTLEVGSLRKGLTILAARRWVARDDPLPIPAGPAAGAPGPGVPTRAPTTAARSRVPPDPELQAVLGRVSEYLDGFLRDFSNVVAEEDYRQRVMGVTNTLVRAQHLRSDLLIVRTSDAEGWIPFRDVFEVNDVPVRDREDRLRKLFLEKPDTAIAEGLRITQEGARYNIGRVYRTINLPTLPLVFLMPANLPSFQFERRGEETVEGLRAWRIDYREVGRPTVVRQRDTGRNMPSTGSLWIDPLTGRIVRTLVSAGDEAFTMQTTVTYRRSEALGIWAPAEMRETYRMMNGAETIVGVATYSHFRRFQVSTQESIKVPKD
jgi:hypothetical protein